MKRFFEKFAILILYFIFVIWGLVVSLFDLIVDLFKWIFGMPINLTIVHWWNMVKEFGIKKIFKDDGIE
jgi:hypothetical protein